VTLIQKVSAFLEARPGYYRPTDVGGALGITTRQACITLMYLHERGQIDRRPVVLPGRTQETHLYGAINGRVLPAQRKAWVRESA